MSTIVGLMILAAAAWMMLKSYERHLQRQVGPWITGELNGGRAQARQAGGERRNEI